MVFDQYFSLPAALARHQSAPLARERERFLTHLEAGGTGRQTIRTAACYLLQVIQILGLRRLRDVTPEEVEQAANRSSRLALRLLVVHLDCSTTHSGKGQAGLSQKTVRGVKERHDRST